MNPPAAEKTLFDFHHPLTPDAEWQTANDDMMGGESHSRFTVANGVAVFSGEVSLKNLGGFAAVRTPPMPLGLAGAGGLCLRVLGDGHRYRFTARLEGDANAVVYQAPFATRRGQWQEYRLPFSDFVATFRGREVADPPPLDPARIASVGFLISDKQEGPFQIEVEWIRIFPPERA